MRIYLDTNILAYFLYNLGELSDDVYITLSDYGNILLVSSVCVQELIHLVQIDKVQEVEKGRRKRIIPETILESIAEAGIEIVPVDKRNLQKYSELPLYDDHRDPNDRLIVAQAISDRVPLVSSDRKLARYARHGLEFVFNER